MPNPSPIKATSSGPGLGSGSGGLYTYGSSISGISTVTAGVPSVSRSQSNSTVFTSPVRWWSYRILISCTSPRSFVNVRFRCAACGLVVIVNLTQAILAGSISLSSPSANAIEYIPSGALRRAYRWPSHELRVVCDAASCSPCSCGDSP